MGVERRKRLTPEKAFDTSSRAACPGPADARLVSDDNKELSSPDGGLMVSDDVLRLVKSDGHCAIVR